MAFQTNQKHDFSGQITTTNRQFVNGQAAVVRLNNPVQMGSGPANMLSTGQRKRSIVSTANQLVDNQDYLYFRVPDYAPQNIKDDMIKLRETDHMLCQQSKRVRMQFAEKQNQAVQHLVDRARTPILKKLKENDEKIVSMGRLISTLGEHVKILSDVKQAWKEYAIGCEFKAMTMSNQLEAALAEVSRLQGLAHPNGAVAAPPEEKKVEFYCGNNVSGKNRQGNAQGCVIVKLENANESAKNVQSGAAETGEGSGEKRMCKSCGKMELSIVALPCRHLCFCIVCGTCETCLHRPCPVCYSRITATAPLSLI